ncbi:transcription factor TGA4-like isoform X1 [Phalaenopsis equestris]|uniref:transcription factor TGA4-like isoform X1 n=1 Tax=Phalaenopsis equestris TaxID=78828 RepID=UPI0009E3D1CF|nr:transcription factor TGA4-like isoform X1 [Phalaenopsis equestris]XP_020588414.1 transcription factor TGA4-like isoform X1 [Phalaenopsis equestris]XP_020588415.1 transcription factor TGA4-like isoform X1 [Phalaenopsis equestris]XP_020588416.1 transcription factor TGA4-like isoform X1 [Phalaenopsis equestris]XP_020588417.1 transcription factor TGA4-like isoform X1 [Phalaenopsis equestris]XP_020588418.1 transcription factor TGA4-like isoform X1 [Phalaenopsis equestris]
MNIESMGMVEMRRMGMYDGSHQIGIWADCFKAESSQNTSSSAVLEEQDGRIENLSEDAHQGIVGPSKPYEQEASKPSDKEDETLRRTSIDPKAKTTLIRRLAQNREAARKSRLRKKAYIQQLELSRIKLAQLEQEVDKVRNQGVYIGEHVGNSTAGYSGSVNSGIAAFELEYGHWIEELSRQICELRAALQGSASEIELGILVENGMRHYENLFRMKSIAAKSDVFYIVSGLWKASAERFFLWIGGFRPSALLKVLSPQLNPLTEQQRMAVCNLQLSLQQAEDALSHGLERLQQALFETLAVDPLNSSGRTSYMGLMEQAMLKLEALASFVDEADNLRLGTLQRMYQILTIRQAARGLLALGDYLRRLRALSPLWAARPRQLSQDHGNII